MTEAIGTKGVIEGFDDFIAIETGTMGTSRVGIGSGVWAYCSVNEGSFASTTDESGGILAITTDTADNDNCFICFGPLDPSNGGVVMETRVKITDITKGAVFAGFSETLDASTPVCPLEFSGTTMTYNGTGGIVGLVHDKDATTADWRAGFGDAGAVATNADANGTRATTAGVGCSAPVNDKWDVIRVEIDASGNAEVYLSADDGGLKLIKRCESAVTATDLFWACVGIENRTSAATSMEIDYAYARGYRDWEQ